MNGFSFQIENDRKIKIIYWADYVSLEDITIESDSCDEIQIWYPQKVDKDIAKEYGEVLSIIEGDEYSFGDRTFSKAINLLQEEEQIFSGFSKTMRYESRRAGERDNLSIEFDYPVIEDKKLNEYVEFYNSFAREKGRAELYLDKVMVLVEKGAFAIATAKSDLGEILVKNAYIVCDDMKMVSHFSSSSLFRSNKEMSQMIGRANGYLHFSAMKMFKKLGYETYDLGGYYAGNTDLERMSISSYKDKFGGVITEYETGFVISFDQIKNIVNNLKIIENKIKTDKVVIYGYSSWGKYLHRILKEKYNIEPFCIIDNKLFSKEDNIESEEILKQFNDYDDYYIIITTLKENYKKICEGECVKPFFNRKRTCCVREKDLDGDN
ncbi:hypothetical protein D6856_09930 [Butyrivibrio sp. XB500-5]|uniref:hypothetical protein n=1 Tax=Butyrivibrio sp. XB500-5 TaxID=2364880 RepID=UPI000EA970B6|nr:hypothetical protein [Butyrivibrio sp. XB500-5]RKM59527.1 hypothetical protein D6856_09930 [Butyrivibrio sp. XB500-5]